jgi:hypothetical protein
MVHLEERHELVLISAFLKKVVEAKKSGTQVGSTLHWYFKLSPNLIYSFQDRVWLIHNVIYTNIYFFNIHGGDKYQKILKYTKIYHNYTGITYQYMVSFKKISTWEPKMSFHFSIL